MSYSSSKNRPFEWASKSQHTHIIKDSAVIEILKRCKFPSNQEDSIDDIKKNIIDLKAGNYSDIRQIVTIDGGYTEVEVRKGYPSSKVSFFQFGALLFSLADLLNISQKAFIHPEDMQKFNQLSRIKLAIPMKGISIDGETLKNSIRNILIEFFNRSTETSTFMSTLKWFLFHEYRSNIKQELKIGSSPFDDDLNKDIVIKYNDVDDKGFFNANGRMYSLIDVFRFHEVIDNEQGASGILGYLTNLIEHVILLHCLKTLSFSKPHKIKEFMFIKDGPLGFFGQTAGLHKDMRELCNFFIEEYDLKIAGVEKSGSFVEHAAEISKGDNPPLKPGNILLLSNDYIYKHILPGPNDQNLLDKLPVYAHTSYYSGKIIFRNESGNVYVITLPIDDYEKIRFPQEEYYRNLHSILNVLTRLKCDMYDNSLIPIALVNKLVSIANHPSSRVLEKFANSHID